MCSCWGHRYLPSEVRDFLGMMCGRHTIEFIEFRAWSVFVANQKLKQQQYSCFLMYYPITGDCSDVIV